MSNETDISNVARLEAKVKSLEASNQELRWEVEDLNVDLEFHRAFLQNSQTLMRFLREDQRERAEHYLEALFRKPIGEILSKR